MLNLCLTVYIGLDKQKKNQSKIVNIFLPISFNICLNERVPTTYVLVEK